jgi:hypothetical protein
MGIRDTARNSGAMRAPAVRIPYDGSAIVTMTLDAGQDPRRVDMHTDHEHPSGAQMRTKSACKGPGCPYCRADMPIRTSWIVAVETIDDDGAFTAGSLWLSPFDFGALARILPDAGTVEIVARYEATEDLRANGEPWTRLVFEVTC